MHFVILLEAEKPLFIKGSRTREIAYNTKLNATTKYKFDLIFVSYLNGVQRRFRW